MELVALSKTCKLPERINPSLNEVLQPVFPCSSGSVFLSSAPHKNFFLKGPWSNAQLVQVLSSSFHILYKNTLWAIPWMTEGQHKHVMWTLAPLDTVDVLCGFFTLICFCIDGTCNHDHLEYVKRNEFSVKGRSALILSLSLNYLEILNLAIKSKLKISWKDHNFLKLLTQ